MTNAVCAADEAFLLVTAIVMATKTMHTVAIDMGICGGSCEADVDADGICDGADNCTDVSACNYDDSANGSCQVNDECGVCGGTGIPAGDCDCDGNQNDALGVCGGSCEADVDADGICDTDEVVGCQDPAACSL